MKIHNAEIELVIMEDKGGGFIDCHHILQYVKTPRGRGKELLIVTEHFYLSGHLSMLQIENSTKEPRDRRRLFSSLLRGSFRPQVKFCRKTLDIFNAMSFSDVVRMTMDFDIVPGM